MTIRKITTPLTDEVVESLHAGDEVQISGVIYQARDAAHKRLVALIEAGEELPFELAGAVVYYVGPSPAKPGAVIGSAGPTTSGRMDAYAPLLIEKGLKGMIGKGLRNEAVKQAMQSPQGRLLRRHRRRRGAAGQAHRRQRGHRLAGARRRGLRPSAGRGLPGGRRHRLSRRRPLRRGPRHASAGDAGRRRKTAAAPATGAATPPAALAVARGRSVHCPGRAPRRVPRDARRARLSYSRAQRAVGPSTLLPADRCRHVPGDDPCRVPCGSDRATQWLVLAAGSSEGVRRASRGHIVMTMLDRAPVDEGLCDPDVSVAVLP